MPRGITVAGEVKNYVPVTDAMLRNPDPADWLMIRRDYKASSFSPLNQITTQNVQGPATGVELGHAGWNPLGNDPAPIVHNGVLYVNNAGKVLQALDAKTGELIWENRYGTNRGRAGDARHHHLRRQRLRDQQRSAPDRLRRPQRQDRLGYHHRRPLQKPALHHQRTSLP